MCFRDESKHRFLIQEFQIPMEEMNIYIINSNKNLVTGEGNGNPLQYSCLENSMD